MNTKSIIVDLEINLTLRQLLPSHMVTFHHLIRCNQSHLREWIISAKITDLESCHQFLRNCGTGDWKFGIFVENQVVGYLEIRQMEQNRAEISYFIAQDWQNQNIVAKSVIAVLKFAKNQLNVSQFYINAFSYNQKSINLAEKIGFKLISTKP